MIVTLKSNAPGAAEITLTDGTTSANTWITQEANFGNSVWEHRFAGARGTQGSRPTQGTPQNRPLVLPVEVRRDTKDQLASTLSQLYEAMDEVRRFGGRVKFKSTNQSYAQYFELLATDGARIEDWGHRAEDASPAYSTVMSITALCAPYLVGDSMTVWDDFSTNTITDYTFDTGGGTLSVSGGQLVPSSTATKRFYHSARGYDYGDVQATWKFTTGASVTAPWDMFVMLKRKDANNYLVIGAGPGALDLYVVTAGSGVNKATTAATISANTSYWVRGRIDGNVVFVELFTSEPTPMATPSATVSHTLAGADANNFGSAVVGKVGLSVTPKGTDWRYDNFVVEPYTYRNQTLPAKLILSGSIPGDAPALADVTITPSGGSAAPVFAMVGWTQRPGTGLAQAPFGVIEAESGGDLSGWVSAADGGSRGGNRLIDTTATDGETYLATWTVDPNIMVPDEYTQGDLHVEVWARVFMDNTLVAPKLTLFARSSRGTNFGSDRYSFEYGSNGKLLTLPSTGNCWRFHRLGTIAMAVDRARAQTWKIGVAGDVASGSSGDFGLDYLVVCPVRQRACSPTDEPNDSYYPDFVASTSETVKMIRSDLSGLVLTTSTTGTSYPDHGLGGSLLELPNGDVDMVVKLSSLAPGDPSSDASSEQLAHSATVQCSVIPRWHFLRGV